MTRGRPQCIISPHRLVNCKICDGQFSTTHSQGRYCSADCRRKGNQQSWRRYDETRAKPDAHKIAHLEVNKAVKRGDLIPMPCGKCGAMPADAHHPDYAKPLEVIWLCKSHHREIHGRNKL